MEAAQLRDHLIALFRLNYSRVGASGKPGAVQQSVNDLLRLIVFIYS